MSRAHISLLTAHGADLPPHMHEVSPSFLVKPHCHCSRRELFCPSHPKLTPPHLGTGGAMIASRPKGSASASASGAGAALGSAGAAAAAGAASRGATVLAASRCA